MLAAHAERTAAAVTRIAAARSNGGSDPCSSGGDPAGHKLRLPMTVPVAHGPVGAPGQPDPPPTPFQMGQDRTALTPSPDAAAGDLQAAAGPLAPRPPGQHDSSVLGSVGSGNSVRSTSSSSGGSSSAGGGGGLAGQEGTATRLPGQRSNELVGAVRAAPGDRAAASPLPPRPSRPSQPQQAAAEALPFAAVQLAAPVAPSPADLQHARPLRPSLKACGAGREGSASHASSRAMSRTVSWQDIKLGQPLVEVIDIKPFPAPSSPLWKRLKEDDDLLDRLPAGCACCLM
eukprot:scaffold1.g5230.t1